MSRRDGRAYTVFVVAAAGEQRLAPIIDVSTVTGTVAVVTDLPRAGETRLAAMEAECVAL